VGVRPVNKYSLIVGFLVVMGVVGAFGASAGWTVNGVPMGHTISGSPTVWGALAWVFSALQFMFQMMTFQVDGMPFWIVLVFYFMSMTVAYVLINLVRGTE